MSLFDYHFYIFLKNLFFFLIQFNVCLATLKTYVETSYHVEMKPCNNVVNISMRVCCDAISCNIQYYETYYIAHVVSPLSSMFLLSYSKLKTCYQLDACETVRK